jgi:hypothetical protein
MFLFQLLTFFTNLQGNGEVPYSEMLGTFSLAVGAAVRAIHLT